MSGAALKTALMAACFGAFGISGTATAQIANTPYTSIARYDIMGRVTGMVVPDPDGAGPRKHPATRNTYDPQGRLIKVERGTVNSPSDADWAAFSTLETVDASYDILDRKTSESKKSAQGAIYTFSQYSYDPAGRPLCTAVRMDPGQWNTQTDACVPQTTGPEGPDRITKLIYNAVGELIETRMAVGTPLEAAEEKNSYTLNGKLASVTDGESNTTTFEYDGHDRLSKTRYPVAAVGALASSTTDYEQLTYDANGNVTQRRLRDGQLHNLTYDNLNRLTFKDVPNTVYYENDISTTYDLMGRPLSVTGKNGAGNGTRSVYYTYDALGRMTGESSPFGGWTNRSYDVGGRMVKLTHPDGFFVNYDYDTTGNVTQIRENGASGGTGSPRH
jgi:YD repeat-containing protein